MISKTCRDFAETELFPIAATLDKEKRFPSVQLKRLGELGMMGVTVPLEYGGSGMDTLSLVIALEEISRGCASTGVLMSLTNSLYCCAIEKYGNIDQKKQYLTPV